MDIKKYIQKIQIFPFFLQNNNLQSTPTHLQLTIDMSLF